MVRASGVIACGHVSSYLCCAHCAPRTQKGEGAKDGIHTGVHGGGDLERLYCKRMTRAGRAVLSASRPAWVVEVPWRKSSVSALRPCSFRSTVSVVPAAVEVEVAKCG